MIERLRGVAPCEHVVDIGLRTEAIITGELLRRGFACWSRVASITATTLS